MKKLLLLTLTLFSVTSLKPITPQLCDYTIKIVTGSGLQEVIPFIAEQRVKIFREYPYLYEGNISEEICALHNRFAKFSHSAVAIAYFGDTPVGFLTGTRFLDTHLERSIEVFIKADLQPDIYYFFPEIVIVPEHQNPDLAKKLFLVMEEYAIKLGYTAACFVTENNDTRMAWQSFFCYVQSELSVTESWPTLQTNGNTKLQDHTLTYWLKNLK